MDKQKIFSNLNLFKGDSDTICEDASIWIDGNIIKSVSYTHLTLPTKRIV